MNVMEFRSEKDEEMLLETITLDDGAAMDEPEEKGKDWIS